MRKIHYLFYIQVVVQKPKGVLHTTGGYMVWTHTTFVNVFNYEGNQMMYFGALQIVDGLLDIVI